MTPADGAPRAVAIAAALGCWVVTIALLLAIPALVIAEGTDMAALTPLGSGLWWATAAVLTLQSGALLGTRAAPRTAGVRRRHPEPALDGGHVALPRQARPARL